MSAKHTEGELEPGGDGAIFSAESGQVVVRVCCPEGGTWRDAEEFAARLTQRWNEHPDLVEALGIARAYVESTADDECGSEEGLQARQDLEKIDALLTRIKEQKS